MYSFSSSSSLSASPSYLSDKPSQGVTLLLNFFLGLFGVDKFYIGRYDLGILQLVLTLTFIGMVITIPWVFLCTISLLIAILYGGLPLLYPGIEWAPLTQTDKNIAWFVLIFMLLGGLIQILTKYNKKSDEKYEDKQQTQLESYICPYCDRTPCICGRGMGMGCQGCSRGMIGPQ